MNKKDLYEQDDEDEYEFQVDIAGDSDENQMTGRTKSNNLNTRITDVIVSLLIKFSVRFSVRPKIFFEFESSV